MFWPRLICLDMVIDTTIRGSFWNLMFLQEGGKGLGETSQGRFSRQNRQISLPLNKILCEFKLIAEMNNVTKIILMGRAIIPNQFYVCRYILRASANEKILKIEPTVFSLKLDKGKVLGDLPPWALSKN